MNAISGGLLLVLTVATLCAPRRWALLAIMAGVFFLTQGQSINVGGLSLWPLRVLEAAAFGRVLLRRELVWSHVNRTDWTVLLAYNYTALVWIGRSSELTAEQFAFALDPTLCYLAFRGLIRELQDFRWLLLAFIPLLAVFTALVALERITGQSSFAVVGGNWTLYVREGVARCQGAFRHASLLGSVAAAFLALYVGLWSGEAKSYVAAMAAVLCLALVVLSNSGGPVTSALAAAVGWAVWPLRRRMPLVRRAIAAGLVFLILFMRAPIWYLPFKVSLLVGGGGYHRGALMESAWNNIASWWLLGMDLRDTVSWIPYAHGETGGADITNEFVTFAIKGGLAALTIWILVLYLAFREIGGKLKHVRLRGASDPKMEALVWGLGVAMSVHVVSWLGIAYFDQSWAIWLLHLAAVSLPIEVAAASPSQLPSDLASPRIVRQSAATVTVVRPAVWQRARIPRRQRRIPFANESR